jgi:hypothetical protein
LANDLAAFGWRLEVLARPSAQDIDIRAHIAPIGLLIPKNARKAGENYPSDFIGLYNFFWCATKISLRR